MHLMHVSQSDSEAALGCDMAANILQARVRVSCYTAVAPVAAIWHRRLL